MNLESLYDKIEHPARLDAADLPALKELCAKYPYAQLFPVLYLKALALNKDLHFEEELARHAYKITDRAKLFDLIHQNEALEPPAQEERFIEAPTAEEPQAVAARQEESTAAEEEAVAPRADEHPEVEPSPEIPEIDELEKEILSGILATAYSLELEEKQAQEEKPATELKEKTDLGQSRSFSSWLKLASEDKTQDTPKKEQDKIIDKFISEEPERIKPKAEFYSAPKKAKESVSEDKLLYTETLANIYALQGNYPKAITAFQQLMLTIPEKKLYFAQKIEELNKKINS